MYAEELQVVPSGARATVCEQEGREAGRHQSVPVRRGHVVSFLGRKSRTRRCILNMYCMCMHEFIHIVRTLISTVCIQVFNTPSTRRFIYSYIHTCIHTYIHTYMITSGGHREEDAQE